MSVKLSRNLVGVAIAAMGVVAFNGSTTSAAPLLAVDVSDRSNADSATGSSGVQAGYDLYLMGTAGGTSGNTSTLGVTKTIGAYSVNVAPTNNSYIRTSDSSVVSGSGTMDDRDRNFSLPSGATTTLVEIYDDFVFNTSNAGGLGLTVSGGSLAPNTPYTLTIYAYDHGSLGTRTANWVDRNNSNALVLTTAFAGNTAPASDAQYRFTGTVLTDGSGVLSVNGINQTALSDGIPTLQGVFLNGFEIEAVPEPTSAALAAGVMGLVSLRRRIRR